MENEREQQTTEGIIEVAEFSENSEHHHHHHHHHDGEHEHHHHHHHHHRRKKKKNEKTKYTGPIIALCVVLLLTYLTVSNMELFRMVYFSNVQTENALDVSGDWTGGTAYRNVVYSDVSPSDYLDLYVPSGETPSLLVLVHGGGFVTNDCESRQTQLFYQYFRDHGYACATVNYRLAQEAKFPAAIQDVKAAVRFLRANAETYGYNADKIAIWGESAGGYLAIMATVTDDTEFNDVPFVGEELLETPVSAKVDALIDYYGAAQLETKDKRLADFKDLGIPRFVVNIANKWVKEALKDVTDVETVEEYWLDRNLSAVHDEDKREYTPAYYINKNLNASTDLNVLVCHGDADLCVPWTWSQRFYERLCGTIGNAHARIRLFHNCGHAGEMMYTDQALGEVHVWLKNIGIGA